MPHHTALQEARKSCVDVACRQRWRVESTVALRTSGCLKKGFFILLYVVMLMSLIIDVILIPLFFFVLFILIHIDVILIAIFVVF